MIIFFTDEYKRLQHTIWNVIEPWMRWALNKPTQWLLTCDGVKTGRTVRLRFQKQGNLGLVGSYLRHRFTCYPKCLSSPFIYKMNGGLSYIRCMLKFPLLNKLWSLSNSPEESLIATEIWLSLIAMSARLSSKRWNYCFLVQWINV